MLHFTGKYWIIREASRRIRTSSVNSWSRTGTWDCGCGNSIRVDSAALLLPWLAPLIQRRVRTNTTQTEGVAVRVGVRSLRIFWKCVCSLWEPESFHFSLSVFVKGPACRWIISCHSLVGAFEIVRRLTIIPLALNLLFPFPVLTLIFPLAGFTGRLNLGVFVSK